MAAPPDIPFWVYRVFAIPLSLPKAGNDNHILPPVRQAEPPPSPPPDPRLTQRLGPATPREAISKGPQPPLNDAAALHALRPALWDYLDVEEKATGRKVKQPQALDEVMRMAEALGYRELSRSRAQTEVVQVVWEMRGEQDF
jgi:hypothetical protein